MSVEQTRLYDISLPISESLIVWPGDPDVIIAHASHLNRGDEATVSHLSLSAHTGTHIDAPCHFVPGGATIDALDPGLFVGAALVVYVPDVDMLTARVFGKAGIPVDTERLILRTRNSDRQTDGGPGGWSAEFYEDFCAIAEDGTRWLVEHGIKLVGIDALSVASFEDTATTHQILLGAGIVVVEGLDLRGIQPGWYRLICLPLRIMGGDGSPARAILVAQAGDPDRPSG